MHIIDGIVNGDLSVREDSELRGMVNGSVTVLAGHLVLRGMLHGDLRACAGASAEVHGMVSGDVLLATGAHASVHGALIGGRMREVEPNAF